MNAATALRRRRSNQPRKSRRVDNQAYIIHSNLRANISVPIEMTEIFSKDFIENLPKDSILAGIAICDAVLKFNRKKLQENAGYNPIEDQDTYLQALALFEAYSEAHNLKIKYEPLNLINDAETNSKSVIEFFKTLKLRLHEFGAKEKLSTYRREYSDFFKDKVVYQFEAAERERLRKLLHELRVLIDDMETVTGSHKIRLLKRLGKIHADMELKLSTLDHLWGLLGEAFVVKAKHGASGRMIVERLYQIVDIVWQVQARADSVDPDCITPTPPLT